MGHKLYDPIKEMPADLKTLIAEEYIRGNFPAKAISSLMGLYDKKVYEYVKFFKDKGPKCFSKSHFTANREAKSRQKAEGRNNSCDTRLQPFKGETEFSLEHSRSPYPTCDSAEASESSNRSLDGEARRGDGTTESGHRSALMESTAANLPPVCFPGASDASGAFSDEDEEEDEEM